MKLRDSAHYAEVSRIYQNLMLYNYQDAYLMKEFERNQLSDKEKKTKFAVASYKYVPMKE
jgi:hypothetical protein